MTISSKYICYSIGFEGLGTITKPAFYKHIGKDMKQGTTKLSKEFAVYLTDEADEGKTSHITFGWHNLSLVGNRGSWNYVPIVPYEPFWSVRMSAFTIFENMDKKDTLLSVCSKGDDCRAIIDTGTSGIGIPGMFYDQGCIVRDSCK